MQGSFDDITCHDNAFDEVCTPLAVHFVVTRDSIADFCDNCNCWPSWKGYSVQIIFGQAEGIWLWATSMQQTCSCSPMNRYQCFIEIALVCIDIHFPLSVLYRELHSFEYLLPLCVFNHPNHCKNSAHIFFSLILLQLSLICKSHLWEPKAPRPGLTCCSLGLIKNVFFY